MKVFILRLDLIQSRLEFVRFIAPYLFYCRILVYVVFSTLSKVSAGSSSYCTFLSIGQGAFFDGASLRNHTGAHGFPGR